MGSSCNLRRLGHWRVQLLRECDGRGLRHPFRRPRRATRTKRWRCTQHTMQGFESDRNFSKWKTDPDVEYLSSRLRKASREGQPLTYWPRRQLRGALQSVDSPRSAETRFQLAQTTISHGAYRRHVKSSRDILVAHSESLGFAASSQNVFLGFGIVAQELAFVPSASPQCSHPVAGFVWCDLQRSSLSCLLQHIGIDVRDIPTT